MKSTIVSITLILLVGSVNPIERPQEPVQQPEPVAQREAPKQTKEPVKKAEKKPEEQLRRELVQKNPKDCDQATEWILWPDGKCKAKGTSTADARPTVAPSKDCESYRPLIAQYSWDVETMMYAMKKESGCNPHAVGDNYVIGGIYAPSCGLLQVRTLSQSRGTCEQLKDPAFNIRKAYEIWSSQSYCAWTVLHGSAC